MNKVYWVQALNLTRILCKFMNRWHNYMPATLTAPTMTFLAAVNTYCDVLQAYDAVHARGKGTGDIE